MKYYCGECSGLTEFRPRQRKEGDLEITSYLCDNCGKLVDYYITDSQLRTKLRYQKALKVKSENLRKEILEESRKLLDTYQK